MLNNQVCVSSPLAPLRRQASLMVWWGEGPSSYTCIWPAGDTPHCPACTLTSGSLPGGPRSS